MEVNNGKGALGGRQGEKLIEGKFRQITPFFFRTLRIITTAGNPYSLRKDSGRR
jgi:hypothetical protein